MSKSNKTIKNEENGNSEDVVTSGVTEIYNREWEEESEESAQNQSGEQVDTNYQELSDQSDTSQDDDSGQDDSQQTDEQPIDSLNSEDVYPDADSAPQPILAPISPTPQQISGYNGLGGQIPQQYLKNPASKLKKIALIVFVFVLVAGGGIAFLVINNKKDSKQPQVKTIITPTPTISLSDEAIDNFIAAILNKNKINADSMQTVAMQQTVKENSDTTSFYDYCQKSGYFCDQLFSKDYLGSGEVKTLDYIAKNGTKGKQRIYTITKTLDAPNSETNSKSVTMITFATIKVGDVWLIDYFNNESNFGVNTNL
ncbi:MAG: hypothetical protein WCP03_03185 [Candidatus Saccharibacteria bacterium]